MSSSIQKGMVLCKAVILNAKVYYSKKWRMVDLMDQLAIDAAIDRRKMNRVLAEIVADEMGIELRRYKPRRAKNESQSTTKVLGDL